MNSWLDELDDEKLGLNIVNWLAKGDTGSTIHVTSGFLSAKVYLDGMCRGETKSIFESSTKSLNIYFVPVGAHTVNLTKEGYKKYSTTVNVYSGETTNVSASLSKLTGSIHIPSDPSGAEIYLDGDYKGTTPKRIYDVEVGSHKLKLTKFGYKDYFDTVTVSADKTTYHSPDLSLAPWVWALILIIFPSIGISCFAITRIGSPNLAISRKLNKTTIKEGDQIRAEIFIQNNGKKPAKSISFREIMPIGLTASGETSWRDGQVTKNGSKKFKYKIKSAKRGEYILKPLTINYGNVLI